MLGEALIDHPTRTQLGAVLSFLRYELRAEAALCVQDGQIACKAEKVSVSSPLLGEAALLLCDLAQEKGVAVRVDDVQDGPFADAGTRAKLKEQGYTSAISVPIQHRGTRHGGLVLWFGNELETRGPASDGHANFVLSAVRQLITLAFERDNRPLAPEGALSSLGEVNRLASLGLMLDGALFALRGPSSSLLIQIDELRRLSDELGLLADPQDHALSDALGDLSQTIDDMTLAASLVRRELTNLSELSSNDEKKETVQLSRLLHEAVVIARPELEHRGFTLQENISSEAYLSGDRHELLHLALGLLFAWTRDERLAARKPVLSIELTGSEDQVRISVQAHTVSVSQPPSPPAACVRIVEAHGGHLSSSPGVLAVTFRVHSAGSLRPLSRMPRIKQVLLVDDDPMFTRALRRALSPHDVRVCATAADAEIALMDESYEPELVVCDLWLPGTNGRALHEKVAESQPQLAPKFVFVSGAPVSSKDDQYFKDSGCDTLAKPIQVSDILARLDIDRMDESYVPGPSTCPPELA